MHIKLDGEYYCAYARPDDPCDMWVTIDAPPAIFGSFRREDFVGNTFSDFQPPMCFKIVEAKRAFTVIGNNIISLQAVIVQWPWVP